VDDALKTRGIVYSNVETSLLFAPPIKISGHVFAIWQHGDLLYIGFQIRSDSSIQLFRFAFENTVVLGMVEAANAWYNPYVR